MEKEDKRNTILAWIETEDTKSRQTSDIKKIQKTTQDKQGS